MLWYRRRGDAQMEMPVNLLVQYCTNGVGRLWWTMTMTLARARARTKTTSSVSLVSYSSFWRFAFTTMCDPLSSFPALCVHPLVYFANLWSLSVGVGRIVTFWWNRVQNAPKNRFYPVFRRKIKHKNPKIRIYPVFRRKKGYSKPKLRFFGFFGFLKNTDPTPSGDAFFVRLWTD